MSWRDLQEDVRGGEGKGDACEQNAQRTHNDRTGGGFSDEQFSAAETKQTDKSNKNKRLEHTKHSNNHNTSECVQGHTRERV